MRVFCHCSFSAGWFPNAAEAIPAAFLLLMHLLLQEYVNLNNSDNYLMAAGAQALISSKAGRAAKVWLTASLVKQSEAADCLTIRAMCAQQLKCGAHAL